MTTSHGLYILRPTVRPRANNAVLCRPCHPEGGGGLLLATPFSFESDGSPRLPTFLTQPCHCCDSAALAVDPSAVVRGQVPGRDLSAHPRLQLLRAAPHALQPLATVWAAVLLLRRHSEPAHVLPVPDRFRAAPTSRRRARAVVGRGRLQRAHVLPAVLRPERRAGDRRSGAQTLPVSAVGGRLVRRDPVVAGILDRTPAHLRLGHQRSRKRYPPSCVCVVVLYRSR
eukprot:COSAG01_NODE_6239_length_3775_cov_1.900979_4_plen_227_part_00